MKPKIVKFDGFWHIVFRREWVSCGFVSLSAAADWALSVLQPPDSGV